MVVKSENPLNPRENRKMRKTGNTFPVFNTFCRLTPCQSRNQIPQDDVTIMVVRQTHQYQQKKKKLHENDEGDPIEIADWFEIRLVRFCGSDSHAYMIAVGEADQCKQSIQPERIGKKPDEKIGLLWFDNEENHKE